MNWQLALGCDADFHEWSFGCVFERKDLYCPKAFGPTKDCACECGKYSGEEFVGIICDQCVVKVSDDAASLRRTRLGHIELARWCRHALGGEKDIVTAFPVAPIAFRIGEDGNPNALGLRYEALIEANVEAARALPEKGSIEYYTAARDFDNSTLQSALDSVVGRRMDFPSNGRPSVEDDGLLGLAFAAIARVDPAASALLRAAGCAVKIDGTI